MPISNVPSNYRLVYSAEDIRERVRELGREISTWQSENENDQLLALCVLRGGVVFFSDLVRQLERSVEMGFCRSWRYGVDNKESTTVKLSLEAVETKGRRILLVDEICDTGKTLKHLHETLVEQGAKEIRSAVLIHRAAASLVFTPNWIAFEYPGKEWFVGYGMADQERYANLPDVYHV